MDLQISVFYVSTRHHGDVINDVLFRAMNLQNNSVNFINYVTTVCAKIRNVIIMLNNVYIKVPGERAAVPPICNKILF